MSSKPKFLPAILAIIAAALPSVSAASAAIANGGFESGLSDWKPLFTREPQTGRVTLDLQNVHAGQGAARVEHTGQKDWSFETSGRVEVEPEDVLELQAWFKLQGAGHASLCVSTWDRDNKVISWSFGAQSVRAQTGWQNLRTRFVIPAGVVRIQPRVIGDGPGVTWLDDFALEKKSNLFALRQKGFPSAVRLSNAALEVTLNTADGTLAVLDRRARRRWVQKSLGPECILKNVTTGKDRLELELFHGPTGLEVTARLQLDPEKPEFTIVLSAAGEMPAALNFPQPFAGEPGDTLVVPMNEGISYNNKLPALWDKRDLFNVLYGVPPMFMFNRQIWDANKARFVQSYRNTCPIVRQVGTSEMTDHRFLTPDRSVQQTAFANGITVTVNFGASPYRLPGGETVPALGYRTTGTH